MLLPGPATHSAMRKPSLRTQTHTHEETTVCETRVLTYRLECMPGISNQQHPESRNPGVKDAKQEGPIPLSTAANYPLGTFCGVSLDLQLLLVWNF